MHKEMRLFPFRTMNADDQVRSTNFYNESLSSRLYRGYNTYSATILEVPAPSICPCCGCALTQNLSPIMAINNSISHNTECDVYSTYRCTSCNHLFGILSHHVPNPEKTLNEKYEDIEKENLEYSCDIVAEYPYAKNTTIFCDEIKNLSSNFVEIYRQAEIAEKENLDQICGMGYRKALEFLVTDYIHYKNKDTEINDDMTLGAKINTYIDDQRIKELSKKSAWLGNDATHVINKHPELNTIESIKKFINALVHFIKSDLAYEEALNL